jgi:hypothetical protein
MTALLRLRHWLVLAGVVLGAALLWLATTDNVRVWPARNTVQYALLQRWWAVAGVPQTGASGSLTGVVRAANGAPVANADVLVSRWDGATHSGRSDANGVYRIDNIPAGRYVPVAGATGFQNAALRRWGLPIAIAPDKQRALDITLQPLVVTPTSPGTALQIEAAQGVRCAAPINSSAERRRVSFTSGERPNQLTFLYTPITGTTTLPTIIAVYPGPADGWECASIPLAQSGYAVLAVGPAYALDLEADIDELERLLQFVRGGAFPRVDGTRIALVAGSYSGLHVQRLLQRDPNVRAALLLGPPTDLFDMRRRLEDGSFIPPFGLDQALRALGLPDRAPERYWRYSGAYHIRPDFPPMALLHSRADDVVPFQQSELLAARLVAADVAHETYFFDGASHYLLGAEGQGSVEDTLEVYRIALDFLGRHLHEP